MGARGVATDGSNINNCCTAAIVLLFVIVGVVVI